jgi:hypothetical protein
MRGVDGSIRATVDLAVEPIAPAQSRVTIPVDFEGHGLGKVGSEVARENTLNGMRPLS